MRPPADSDFFVEVPEVGTFRFARRTYGDRLKIRAEFLKLVRDVGEADPELATQAAIVAAHKVLCVDAPPGWGDLAAVDMIAVPDADDRIYAIYLALKEKEDSFRRPTSESGEAARA